MNGEGEDAGVVYCEMQGRENMETSRTFLNFTRKMYPGHCGYKVSYFCRENCLHCVNGMILSKIIIISNCKLTCFHSSLSGSRDKSMLKAKQAISSFFLYFLVFSRDYTLVHNYMLWLCQLVLTTLMRPQINQ